MRRVNRRALVILAVILAVSVLGGCNWLVSPFNHMTIDGTRYTLDDLYLVDVGQEDGLYAVAVVLVSDGIEAHSLADWRGSGEELGLFLISRSPDLDNGTYRYGSSFADFTLGLGYAGVNVDYDRNEWPEEYSITGGTVDLRKTLRDGYVLEFDLRAESPDAQRVVDIEGRFRGLVQDRFRAGMMASESPIEQRFNFSW